MLCSLMRSHMRLLAGMPKLARKADVCHHVPRLLCMHCISNLASAIGLEKRGWQIYCSVLQCEVM